ncbi:DUF4166 domain-containing protein [Cognatilysobacter bugurensis]|uniref:DUF4166 domain-containing protein n=1 Tax=Cognatilysobacter bugurensis TaxID=543356 RepID=A0A918W543_9GAMM|nr:DUF4166 domain-containing protein [Lysobacter bugurensis]GHA69742.1 hypothetical protein GCM10007067_02180 [Lysobacter bugurensis]
MSASAGPALFPRLLGARFARLPPAVQRLHLHTGKRRYHGEIDVERGRHWLARACAWATRLPPGGRGPVHVDIESSPQGETWARCVGPHVMRSRMWATRDRLCERLGLVTFEFELDVENDALIWRVAGARALGAPLPVGLFRGVSAKESEVDGRYRFDVCAALPLAGLLVHYRGWLHVDA